MIKVLLVDDREMVRFRGFFLFVIQEDIEVIGEAEDGRKGLRKSHGTSSGRDSHGLVMEEMDGIGSTKAILKDWPEAKIIIVTSFIDDEKVYPAIEAAQQATA